MLAQPILLVLGLLCLELFAISILYNHSFEFECRASAPAFFCAFLSQSVIRAICVMGALAVFLMARSAVASGLLARVRPRPALQWLMVQVAGFVLILLPWTFVSDGVSGLTLSLAAVLWLTGGALAAIGAALALIPGAGWRHMLAETGLPLFGILLIAGLAPEIAAVFQNVWKFDPLTEATFRAAQSALEAVGYTVVSDPPTKLLGIDQFLVLVGPQCSGVEGFLLISAFLAFYIWLFRSDLKFPRVWLLLPIGLAFSWVFNVGRITLLILVGHHVSPNLAINGFHSHAGWLMFTVLAVSLAFTAHKISWFRKTADAPIKPRREVLPLAQDPYAAQILPFICFMASILLLSTFTEIPGLYYPVRFLVMAAILAFFYKYIRDLEWSLDALSLGIGAAIGVLWLVTAAPPETEPSDLMLGLGAMSGTGFAIWVIARVLGTSLLVPIIEELFFRGYVLRRIDHGGMVLRIVAFAVSSGLFAALHDRWIAAFLAGIVFGLLMLRRGRVSDAILAHMAANAVIAAWALYTQNWALI